MFLGEEEMVVRRAVEECLRELGKELSTEVRVLGDANANDDNAGGFDGWFWKTKERHRQYKERKAIKGGGKRVEMFTLSSLMKWLAVYGTRSPSIVVSAKSMPVNRTNCV